MTLTHFVHMVAAVMSGFCLYFAFLQGVAEGLGHRERRA